LNICSSQAKLNAEANGIETADFLAGDAAQIFSGLPSVFSGAFTAVVLDPPRKGCDASFIKQLITFAPRRIVYVSCGPDTQASHLVSNLVVSRCRGIGPPSSGIALGTKFL